jgi:heme A synthase
MVILAVLSLAGLGTGILFAVSVVAYRRRRSRRYALITVAVGALFLRSILGLGTVLGIVPMPIHHLLGHGLDFTIAALILSAVYRSGSGDADPGSEFG